MIRVLRIIDNLIGFGLTIQQSFGPKFLNDLVSSNKCKQPIKVNHLLILLLLVDT